MAESVDILIIGGGIAGISLAARLAGTRKVAVVEAEQHLGSHATGRSAALLVEAYGPPEIRLLTGWSRSFFETPPAGFSEARLARRRGGLVYAGAPELPKLQEEYELAGRTAAVTWLDAEAVRECCPLLRPGVAAAGFLEPNAMDLDAAALLEGFARAARHSGVQIHKEASVGGIERKAGRWRITAGAIEIGCDILVDAAGAWADPVAELAGAARCGLQPMRRSAATLPVPADMESLLADLPFVAPVDESFYFKPEARSIMVSLADETPSDPCDAFAEDLDVAMALERFHEATLAPRARPTATWAGLRTFAPDRKPVLGFDPDVPDFFWCAGQGGYGIQTSPALSSLAAKLLGREPLQDDEAGIAAAMAPARLRRSAGTGGGAGRA